MTYHNRDAALSAESCASISKIFNIPVKEVERHSFLFSKIDSDINNCLYYLSKIDDEENRITTSFCLEFLAKFKKSPL